MEDASYEKNLFASEFLSVLQFLLKTIMWSQEGAWGSESDAYSETLPHFNWHCNTSAIYDLVQQDDSYSSSPLLIAYILCFLVVICTQCGSWEVSWHAHMNCCPEMIAVTTNVCSSMLLLSSGCISGPCGQTSIQMSLRRIIIVKVQMRLRSFKSEWTNLIAVTRP